jgi:ADP-heptose:LPS heptosyltransferase
MKRISWKRLFALGTSGYLQEHKRILLGQLASYGDCLFATAIARQIKSDYPGCKLTWAVGSAYRSILNGNPYVDEVWEIPMKGLEDLYEAWYLLEREAFKSKDQGEFDEIFLTQICPNNFHKFDGTVRSSIFRAYPRQITVPIAPVIYLSEQEMERVRLFAEEHALANYEHVILFECSPKSGQSFVTSSFALEVAEKIVQEMSKVCLILSSNEKIRMSETQMRQCIIDGSVLSFRENAELTKYCSLLVGCSSGISWLSTSEWARPLPMIQLLTKDSFVYASIYYDHKYYGLCVDNIIEMTDCSADKLSRCILFVLQKGFDTARTIFNEEIPRTFDIYGRLMSGFLIEGEYRKAAYLFLSNIKRHKLSLRFIFWHFSKLAKYGLKLLRRAILNFRIQ